MMPMTLPNGTGMRARHFTPMVVALVLVGTALVANTVGKWMTYTSQPSSWTQSPERVPVTIGDIARSIPANMMRHSNERAGGGEIDTLHLAVLWPSLEGYSQETARAFADPGDRSPVLSLSLRADTGGLDTNERFERVWMSLAAETRFPGRRTGPSSPCRRRAGGHGFRGPQKTMARPSLPRAASHRATRRLRPTANERSAPVPACWRPTGSARCTFATGAAWTALSRRWSPPLHRNSTAPSLDACAMATAQDGRRPRASCAPHPRQRPVGRTFSRLPRYRTREWTSGSSSSDRRRRHRGRGRR